MLQCVNQFFGIIVLQLSITILTRLLGTSVVVKDIVMKIGHRTFSSNTQYGTRPSLNPTPADEPGVRNQTGQQRQPPRATVSDQQDNAHAGR